MIRELLNTCSRFAWRRAMVLTRCTRKHELPVARQGKGSYSYFLPSLLWATARYPKMVHISRTFGLPVVPVTVEPWEAGNAVYTPSALGESRLRFFGPSDSGSLKGPLEGLRAGGRSRSCFRRRVFFFLCVQGIDLWVCGYLKTYNNKQRLICCVY